MARLTIDDITDELIKPIIQADPSILAEADDYLDDFAHSYGHTSADIPQPLPYKVKRLAVAFICREVCARKAGGATGNAYRSQEAADKWTAKLPYWTSEVRTLSGQITADVLTGRTASATLARFSSIAVRRG